MVTCSHFGNLSTVSVTTSYMKLFPLNTKKTSNIVSDLEDIVNICTM